WFRLIGRLAFPIYAFLIANGYRHTRNPQKYLLRLAVFALISEIPYDITFNKAILEFSRQNIFLTLGLGLAGLMLKDWLKNRISQPFDYALALAITASAAELSGASYGAIGIVTIFIYDLWLSGRIHILLASLLIGLAFYSMNWVQFWGVLASVPIYFYNGKPGKQNRVLQYAFYMFYPVHMLVLHYLF
ncbi:MAG: conjugal transfer protein TraX, partial [Symbiobacteriaceae bacterium]|nr:conjugal transfer protein TraX [Symbiobacteriaceae bacterium]